MTQMVKSKVTSTALLPEYSLGLRVPAGEIYLKQFFCPTASEEIRGQFEAFAQSLGVTNPQKELFNCREPFSGLGSNRFRPYSAHDILRLSRPSPIRSKPMAIRVLRPHRESYVTVKVIAMTPAKVVCRARYNNSWVTIELDRRSLEAQDLREGDLFEWIPNEKGLVSQADIRRHPRRDDKGESERTQQVFAALEKITEPA